jgi:exonuclease VII small subunit
MEIALEMVIGGRATTSILSIVSSLNSSQRDLDRQVSEAMSALSNSTKLISELEESLQHRADKLRELQNEYERVSKLAEITEEQGIAIAETLERTLGKNQPRERWIAFAISIIAGLMIFVFGVFASDWVKGIPSYFSAEIPTHEQLIKSDPASADSVPKEAR